MSLVRHPLPVFLLCFVAVLFTGCGSEPDVSSEVPVEAVRKAFPKQPDLAIQAVFQAVGEGDGARLWDALPASYQDDVTTILQFAGQKVDAELYDRSLATLNRVIEVADKQKEFVFNTTLGGPRDPEEMAKLRQAWPSLVGLIQTLGSSEIATAAGLRSFDGSKFFRDTVSPLLTENETLSKLNPNPDTLPLSGLKEAQVSLLENTASTATLRITMPNGEEEEGVFVKVDERWVPHDMALGWSSQIAGARAALETIDPEALAGQKAKALTIFSIIDGVLMQAELATTQEAFDQALQGAALPIMTMLMMGQGGGMPMGPSSPALPHEPAPSAPEAPLP